MPLALELRLFGPMAVRLSGRPLRPLRTRKGLWLLAILALRGGRDVDRTWLASTLWPDSDDAHALRSLRQSLHDLRLALGSEAWRLSADSRRDLRFELAGVATDALSVDDLASRADPESLEAAVRLHRGTLLEGCGEEWVVEERRNRERAYIAAFEKLASAASGAGSPLVAAQWLRRAIDADPYREDLYGALMRALEDAGDDPGALIVFRNLRSFLLREMAAAPDEALTAAYEGIRERMRRRASSTRTSWGRPARDPTGPEFGGGRLPVPLTGLVDRDKAVAEVRQLLQRSRLVTLTGPGGVGKTRLAIEVATEAEVEFLDGCRFVGLASLTDGAHLPSTLCASLGVRLGDGAEDPLTGIERLLAGRQVLLVLDNCEHLARDCAEIGDALLSGCPNLTILATSRHPLAVQGETVWRVPTLQLPPKGCPGLSAEGYGAVRLFLDRALEAEASFKATPHNTHAVVRICRQLDGIPLAIELAAARTRSLPLDEITRRLQVGIAVLGDATVAAGRHKTLEAAFRWSWDLLTVPERRVWARLSVFSGGWDLESAKEVCADEELDGDQVVDVLSSLVDQSLVQFVPEAAADDPLHSPLPARYHLLEPVRQFARERLLESGDEPTARDHHRDYFMAWVEKAAAAARADDHVAWLALQEREHDNLRDALDWSRAQGDVEKEARLCWQMCDFWSACGYLREARERYEGLLPLLKPEVPWRLRADVIGCAGWVALVQSDHEAAIRHTRESLALYCAADDRPGIAHLLNIVGCSYLAGGACDDARSHFELSLQACRDLGDDGGVVTALSNLGDVALRQGDLDAARRHLAESARLDERWPKATIRGITRCLIGLLELREGRLDAAEAQGSAGLRVFRDRGATIEIPSALDLLAAIAAARRDWPRAALLLGASDGYRLEVGIPLDYTSVRERGGALAATEAVLSVETLGAAIKEARGTSLDHVVAIALHEA